VDQKEKEKKPSPKKKSYFKGQLNLNFAIALDTTIAILVGSTNLHTFEN
jgi:hypothetical protein